MQGTGGLLEDPRLVGGDPRLDQSSWLHPAAWSTLAGQGERRRTNEQFSNVLKCGGKIYLEA